jgi:hypothetical protein
MSSPHKMQEQLPHRAKVVTVLLGVLSAVAVPFVATGLLQLGLSLPLVAILLVAAAVVFLLIPQRGSWLAIGWAIGLVTYVVLLSVVLWQFGQGSAGFD